MGADSEAPALNHHPSFFVLTGATLHQRIAQLGHQVLDGNPIDRADAGFLCELVGDDLYDLFYWANRIRTTFVGRQVRFCAIIPAKLGGCTEDCKFCSQSSRYKTAVGGQTTMTQEQIVDRATQAAQVGAHHFGIVNSGRGPSREELENWLGPVIRRLAADGKTSLCADLGQLTPQTARYLHECGIRRVNHNLETSERFYPQIVSTHSYGDRVNTIRIAKAAGLEVCSGGIFGMGETWTDRLDMLFALRDLGVDVVPINFLNPIPGTPLQDLRTLSPMECLKIISISRFILHDKELKVAGGREICLRDLQSWMFYAGASSAIIGNYLSTVGRTAETDQQMVRDLGLESGHCGGGDQGDVAPSSRE